MIISCNSIKGIQEYKNNSHNKLEIDRIYIYGIELINEKHRLITTGLTDVVGTSAVRCVSISKQENNPLSCVF